MPDLDYEAYERQPGMAFTPVPVAMPLPTDACADQPEQMVFDGTHISVDCTVPADTCARILDGAEVVCADGMTIDGMVVVLLTCAQRCSGIIHTCPA